MPHKEILKKMNVAVVDDHDLIREGLNCMLAGHGIDNIDKFATAMALIESLDRGVRYDFFILDLELPDLDGFVLIEMIRARNPIAHIIVSTVHDEIWTLRKLLARDVNAIIYKSGNSDEIVTAMLEILEGRQYYCAAARKALGEAGDSSLHPSAREMEVLYQIYLGKTSKEIAETLFVSENTVEAHRKSLFLKLGAVNVVDLVVKAQQRGYIKR
jgi:hypothetical protein